MKITTLALGVAVLLAAPAANAADPTVYRVFGVNRDLAGRDLNGTTLNGEELDGHGLQHVAFDGARAGAVTLQAVWLDGSELKAGKSHGHKLTGQDLVGVTLDATLDTGGTLPLRIDAVHAGAKHEDRDMFRYTVSYQAAEGWLPLCGVDENAEAVQAIALEGNWDYGQGQTGGAHTDDP
jgi:hypothetical protein